MVRLRRKVFPRFTSEGMLEGFSGLFLVCSVLDYTRSDNAPESTAPAIQVKPKLSQLMKVDFFDCRRHYDFS